MKIQIHLPIILAFFVLISCSPPIAQKEPTVSPIVNPIKIGAIAALTGNIAIIGQEERLGLEIAVDEINAGGGILINGVKRPIKIILEDGKCDPKEATTAATKLVEVDGVKIILGGTCTGESMAIAKITNEKKIIQMAAVTSASVYSNTGEWTFRTNPVDNAKDFVEFLLGKGYRRFALISEQTDFSQSIRTDFKKWVVEGVIGGVSEGNRVGGGVIVADENFDSKETDYRTPLTKLKETKADAYFLNTNSGILGVQLARQAKELGLSPLYGSRAFEAARASEFPSELEGIVFYGTAGVVNMEHSAALALFSEYKKRNGKEPFSPFAVASRYDDVKLIGKALEACGEENECIKNWLYSMPPYSGVIGTFTFDKNGDPQGIKYAFSVFQKGKVVSAANI